MCNAFSLPVYSFDRLSVCWLVCFVDINQSFKEFYKYRPCSQHLGMSVSAKVRSRSPVRRNIERVNNHNSAEKSNEGRNTINSKPEKPATKTPNLENKPIKVIKSVPATNVSTPKVGKTSNNTPRSHVSRTYANPVTGKMERKFSNRCRLFVGNIIDITEEEFKKMFDKFGEYSEVYINKEKAFGFIRMDTRMNAEAAKNALDGFARRGRTLTVRFASISGAIHVSNLGPLVSNEMLEKAFSTFGDVERAVVVVDDRGRSKGYGVVEFARKSNAMNAMQRTNEGFFMIGRSPRPVFTKQQEQTDEEEGLVEKALERQKGYNNERDAGARFATPGTFEYDWCQKWKALDEMQRSKNEILEKQFLEVGEKLEADMLQAVLDYENEMNRREILAKQEELRRQEEMMRQELLRQQTMDIRRHEEARIQDELRRQDEMRIQEEVVFRRQHEEMLRRRQHEEAAILHGGRMPHPFGGMAPMPGMMGGSAVSPHSHALAQRVPLGPMSRGLPPNDPRHQVMAYEIKAERARDHRPMERGDRARAPRYNDHPPHDRYGDNRNNR